MEVGPGPCPQAPGHYTLGSSPGAWIFEASASGWVLQLTELVLEIGWPPTSGNGVGLSQGIY